MPTDQTPVYEGAMPLEREDWQLVLEPVEQDAADALDSGKVHTNHGI